MDIILIAGLWLDASVWEQTAALTPRATTHPGRPARPGRRQHLPSPSTTRPRPFRRRRRGGRCEPIVVGHSAACGLAWLAADARPDRVGAAVAHRRVPERGRRAVRPLFPLVDGVMPFPGWEPFEGPDSADLDEAPASGSPPGPSRCRGGSHGHRHLARRPALRRAGRPRLPGVLAGQVKEWADGGTCPSSRRSSNLSTSTSTRALADGHPAGGAGPDPGRGRRPDS